MVANNIPTAFTLLDLMYTGKGIAFRKVSDKDAIEFGIPIESRNGKLVNSPVSLPSNTDLDTTILTRGYYTVLNTTVSATILNKPVTNTNTFLLEVLMGGQTGTKIQRFTLTTKFEKGIWERDYYLSGWGSVRAN